LLNFSTTTEAVPGCCGTSIPKTRRANKRRGHGTCTQGFLRNDRSPVVGTVGRTTGQVRLRVLRRTDGKRLCPHVHGFTEAAAVVYTDKWKGYNRVERDRQTVCHSAGEWARDDDGDGSARFMSTRSKVCGQRCEIFCTPSEEFTRSTWLAMWPSVGSRST